MLVILCEDTNVLIPVDEAIYNLHRVPQHICHYVCRYALGYEVPGHKYSVICKVCSSCPSEYCFDCFFSMCHLIFFEAITREEYLVRLLTDKYVLFIWDL